MKENMERSRRENRQEVSFILCCLLDNVGFSESIRKFRTHAFEQVSTDMSRKYLSFLQFVITGSRAEGASLMMSSDMDIMTIFNDVFCLSSHETNAHFTTLKASESPDVPPGYVKVIASNIVDQPGFGLLCERSLFHRDSDGYPFVSSAIFRNYASKTLAAFPISNFDFLGGNFEGANGPASTLIVQTPFYNQSMDQVYAIYYYESKYLSNWSSRNEFKSWLTRDMIKEVSTMEGYIVPVGSLEGYYTSVEWRVSYVTAENKLIQYCNESQFKLYVLLKMIAKELIKPDFPVMSSYVIKNVVLWVCELSPRSFFRSELLIEQVAKCLKFIKNCVLNNHLPNYLIPERNLLSRRLEAYLKQNLIARLNYLIEHGDSIYCRLQTFVKHSFLLTFEPSMKYAYGKKRDKIETCYLLFCALCARKLELPHFIRYSLLLDINWACFQDISFMPIFTTLMSLVVPEWMDLLLSGDFSLVVQLMFTRLKYFLE